MDKTTFFVLFTVLKFVAAFVVVIIAAMKKGKTTATRIALTFLAVIGTMFVLTVIEFIIGMNYPRV